MELYFASGNQNKVEEVRSSLPESIVIKSLKDLDIQEEIPETAETLEGNALLKARFLAEKFNISVFADDTGLEIDALNAQPGVYSARYAGPKKNSQDNMAKVLGELEGHDNRTARFRTVVALILDGKEYQFEGIAEGSIRRIPSGEKGFGYDPIFEPEGCDITFAEMDLSTKSKISHRGKAIQKLVKFLKEYVES